MNIPPAAPKMCANCAATMDAAAKAIRERDALQQTVLSIRAIYDAWAAGDREGARSALETIHEVLEGA